MRYGNVTATVAWGLLTTAISSGPAAAQVDVEIDPLQRQNIRRSVPRSYPGFGADLGQPFNFYDDYSGYLDYDDYGWDYDAYDPWWWAYDYDRDAEYPPTAVARPWAKLWDYDAYYEPWWENEYLYYEAPYPYYGYRAYPYDGYRAYPRYRDPAYPYSGYPTYGRPTRPLVDIDIDPDLRRQRDAAGGRAGATDPERRWY